MESVNNLDNTNDDNNNLPQTEIKSSEDSISINEEDVKSDSFIERCTESVLDNILAQTETESSKDETKLNINSSSAEESNQLIEPNTEPVNDLDNTNNDNISSPQTETQLNADSTNEEERKSDSFIQIRKSECVIMSS